MAEYVSVAVNLRGHVPKDHNPRYCQCDHLWPCHAYIAAILADLAAASVTHHDSDGGAS